MDTKKYNGWTNYETWCVSLWFDNDSSEYWTERAGEIWNDSEADGNFSREEIVTLALSKDMQDSVEENTPTVTGMFADLLNASLSEVNWYEIAEHYIDDVDKDESEVA